MWTLLDSTAHLRKIAIDLPGHGKSPLISYQSMEDLARMVLGLLDELQIESYELIGHSMGGYLALEMLRMDTRCESLILLNSNTWCDDPQKQLDRQRVANLVMHSKKHFIYEAIPHLFWKPEDFPKDVEELIHEAAEMTPEAIAMAALAMSRRRDLTDFARQAGKKILIVQGEFDAVVPLEKMRALELDKHCSFALIPASGHMSLYEQQALVQDLLTEKWV